VPDWRWLLDRSDSPWYPTLKLFRQPEPGDWASVFAAMVAQLAEQLMAGPSEAPHRYDIEALFGEALAHHVRGQLTEALAIYDTITRLDPNAAAVHCNRGIALQSLNRFEEAVRSYDRALRLKPDLTEAYNNKANALLESGRLNEALQNYDHAIALNPHLAEAHHNKGKTLLALHRPAEAVESYDRATSLKPDYADAYYNRGNALQELKRPQEALQSYDHAIKLKPDFAEAFTGRGNALNDLKRLDEALLCFDQAIALKPDLAEAYNNRGNIFRSLKRPEEALLDIDRAIALKPDYAKAYGNKGNVLQDLERLEEALEAYDRAIALKPDLAHAYTNIGRALGDLKRPDEALRNGDCARVLEPDFAAAHNGRAVALQNLGRYEEALESFDNAIVLDPDYANAKFNKSTCILLQGNWAEGWRLYEWRKKKADPAGSRTFPQPEWTGNESLEGKTLFIHAEQGLGDTIQFCRYALLAEAKGAKVIFAVHDGLVRLFRGLSPAIEIIPLKGAPAAFDTHIALMSMPLAFRTTLSSCPAKVPYLHAEPEKIATWKTRLGCEGFKVGICWQGSKIVPDRAFPVAHFEAIAKLPNVRLISLQKNDGTEQLRDLARGMKVETLGEDFDAGPDAFIDTAAVMQCLDLVITSDTAIAHLAGALARPTWIALKYVPDWRWLLDRSDSPWYPTLRLFRQPAPGDWPSVFAAIQAQLIEEIGLEPNEGA
jgi:tetratricopeptide (TPR) repeat protein